MRGPFSRSPFIYLSTLHCIKISNAIDGYFIDRGLELADTAIKNYRHYFMPFAEFIGDYNQRRGWLHIHHRKATELFIVMGKRNIGEYTADEDDPVNAIHKTPSSLTRTM